MGSEVDHDLRSLKPNTPCMPYLHAYIGVVEKGSMGRHIHRTGMECLSNKEQFHCASLVIGAFKHEKSYLPRSGASNMDMRTLPRETFGGFYRILIQCFLVCLGHSMS